MEQLLRHLFPHARQADLQTLLRLAMWGTAACAALLLTVLVGSIGPGSRRLADTAASVSESAQVFKPAPANPELVARTDELTARAAATENETRALSDAIRGLTADRDRLIGRIASIERSLEQVTGSIKHQHASPPAQSLPAVATAPAAARRDEAVPAQREASADAAAPITEARETGRAAFGVDLGGAMNFDALRLLWRSVGSANATLFEGLQPLFVAREVRSRGIELRLIIGPFGTAQMATDLCAALTAAKHYCQPATYEGQRLASTDGRPATASQRASGAMRGSPR